MKYETELKVYGDTKKILDCFKPEMNKQGRSTFDIQDGKGYLIFKIQAEDSVALRATLNSITKLLTVYEKIEGLKK